MFVSDSFFKTNLAFVRQNLYSLYRVRVRQIFSFVFIIKSKLKC